MSNIYDNWERLVEVVLRREQLRQLALISSREPSSCSLSSSISGWSTPIRDDQNIQLGSSSSTVNKTHWERLLPPDYENIISRSVNPVAYATKEDLYKSLCSSPILLDGGKMSMRALRALKALVKLQALVRGHLVRKQAADMVRGMQAMLRAQARARAGRALISEYPHLSLKSSHFNYRGPATPEKLEHVNQTRSMKHEQLLMLKRNGSKSNPKVINDSDKALMGCNWMDNKMLERSWENGSSTRSVPTDDERSDKIPEVDAGKPHLTSKNRTLPHLSHLSTGLDQNSRSFSVSKDSISRQTVLSPSSEEVQSLSPLKFVQDVDETNFCTADNSPQFYSASSMGGSSKRGPFTPTKSDGSRSCLSGYSDHPNYMSYTESSKAKVRSFSAKTKATI